MRILGIDPGFGIIGFGVIDKSNSGLSVVDYGVITTPKDMEFNARLEVIYHSMAKIIDRFQPDEVAIEELYFNNNITTGIKVAEARGIILLSFQQAKLPIFEYTPQDIKLALTGTGRADKSQMKFMVKTLLHLQKSPTPDDAADAVAVALCHSQTNQNLRARNAV